MGSNTAHAALRGPSQRIEALDGESLERRLERQGRLPAIDALRITAQLAAALAPLHDRGAVHRALSPRNVFLVRDPEAAGGERAQLLDLSALGAATEAITSSPRYMSPEQVRNIGELDARADIYALGCLLYHLLIGRPPFVADASTDLLAMHLYETPTPPSVVLPFLGGALDGLVMRCLAKSPAERYPHVNDVLAEVERLLTTNVLAIPPGGVDLAAVSNRWALSSVVAAMAGDGTTTTTALAPAPISTLRRWRALVAALAAAATAAALFALARWF